MYVLLYQTLEAGCRDLLPAAQQWESEPTTQQTPADDNFTSKVLIFEKKHFWYKVSLDYSGNYFVLEKSLFLR